MEELAAINWWNTYFGLGGRMIVMIAIGVIFVYIAWTDWRTFRIPNRALYWLLAAVVCHSLADPSRNLWERLIGAFCVSVPMFLLAAAFPGSLGGGDVKLMAVCGILLGWRDCLTAAVLAFISGGLWASCLLLSGKRGPKSRLAFGPFLIAATVTAYFWGEAIRDWYVRTLGGGWL